MAGKGHQERLPATRLSGRCGFRKETIAGMRRNGRDAPIAAVGLLVTTGQPDPNRPFARQGKINLGG